VSDQGQARSITGADRRHLRGLAHSLKPVVRIGDAGLTERVVVAVDAALDDHELIEVKIVADRAERKAIAEDVARRIGGELAGLVGQVAILYRPAVDPERRAIVLPSVGARPASTEAESDAD
jgi:RNA-binding protein